MKILVLTMLLGISTNFSYAQIPKTFLGEWKGTGTLMGNKANFEMKWEQVLNDQFLKLTFENGFSDGSFSMQANAYYQLKSDGTFTGYWFDSRGISFPLKGIHSSASITTEWENSGIEKGQSEYKILESGEIQVSDFVFRDGTYQKFAEATYQQKNK